MVVINFQREKTKLKIDKIIDTMKIIVMDKNDVSDFNFF